MIFLLLSRAFALFTQSLTRESAPFLMPCFLLLSLSPLCLCLGNTRRPTASSSSSASHPPLVALRVTEQTNAGRKRSPRICRSSKSSQDLHPKLVMKISRETWRRFDCRRLVSSRLLLQATPHTPCYHLQILSVFLPLTSYPLCCGFFRSTSVLLSLFQEKRASVCHAGVQVALRLL